MPLPTHVTAEGDRPVLVLDDIHKIYNPGPLQVHVLKGISLAVERGDYVAIMGHSGSGKSTMLNILGCLDVPSSGKYLIDGVDVAQLTEAELADVRNQFLGFVFQSFNLVRRTSALANVELPLVYAGVAKSERRRRAITALGLVGLEDGRLNAAGRTIVIITHEDDVAAHAKRVITLADGRVASDHRKAPVAGEPPRLIDLTALEDDEVAAS